MPDLLSRHCRPIPEGSPSLTPAEAEALLAELDEDWSITGFDGTVGGAGSAGDDRRLVRRWKLRDFAGALDLVNRIGAIAEAEDHHPDIALAWGRVEVALRTHSVDGLSENDFLLAARIDAACPRDPRRA